MVSMPPMRLFLKITNDFEFTEVGKFHVPLLARSSYTMRNAPPMVNWRCRVKVNGVVTPSPVGVAML